MGRFSALPTQKELFELAEVLPAHLQAPSPVVLVKGVLWRRQETILAEQRIKIYLEDLERDVEQESVQGG